LRETEDADGVEFEKLYIGEPSRKCYTDTQDQSECSEYCRIFKIFSEKSGDEKSCISDEAEYSDGNAKKFRIFTFIDDVTIDELTDIAEGIPCRLVVLIDEVSRNEYPEK
jgi:hypothetical protein